MVIMISAVPEVVGSILVDCFYFSMSCAKLKTSGNLLHYTVDVIEVKATCQMSKLPKQVHGKSKLKKHNWSKLKQQKPT